MQSSRGSMSDNDDDNLLRLRGRDERGSTLVELDNVEFRVKRIAFARQTSFRLDDHLFQFDMISHARRAPLLSKVLKKLKEAIKLLVIEFQDLYPAENRHQVYLTFDDRAFTRGGINTGNYSIHSMNDSISDEQYAEKLAEDSLDILASVLRSYDHLKLQEGFHVFFRILSVPHMYQKFAQKSFREPRNLVGIKSGKSLPLIARRFVAKTSKNLFQVPDLSAFSNMCLIVSMIMGFYYRKYRKFEYSGDYVNDARDYKVLKMLRSERIRDSDGAVRLLQEKIAHVCDSLHISKKGPHVIETTLPKLCNFFNVQAHVFTNVGSQRRFSYPSEFCEDLPQIYLYEDKRESETCGHISLILKLYSLFKKCGIRCFRCPKQVKGYKKHKCRGARKCCFVCTRYLVKDISEVYIDKENVREYCIQNSQNLGYDKKCDTCGLVSKTYDCFSAHANSLACRRGIVCDRCSTYVYCGGGRGKASGKDALKHHRCFHLRCRYCNEYYRKEEEHSCQIRPQGQQEYFSNLGFFDFEATQGVGTANCFDCFKMEKRLYEEKNTVPSKVRKRDVLEHIRCEKHKGQIKSTSYHDANFCTCLYEDEVRGHFSLITFADPDMQHPEDCKIRKNYYICNDYLPADERGRPVFSKNVARKSFGGQSSKIKFPLTLQSDHGESPPEKRLCIGGEDHIDLNVLRRYGVLEKFWIFFGREKFRSYVFLAHHSAGYDSVHLCRSAFAHSLTPSIITRGNKILCMAIPSLNLHILDSMQYTHCSLLKLADRYNQPVKGDFPHMFNKKENYTYSGIIPPLEEFCDENAAEASKLALKRHIDEHRAGDKEWNFKEEIFSYCLRDTEILCKSMLLFLKEWFLIQSIFMQFFERDNLEGKKTYLHPFTPPFITFSSFIYGCYRRWEAPQYDLRTLNDEKGLTSINTSIGELQYVLYKYKEMGKPEDFASRYTSEKSPRIGAIFPDFYIPSKRTVGFFHGCVFHGHLDDSCNLVPYNATSETKNFLGQTFGQCADRFMRQCETLKKEHGIEHILVMWECEWKRLRDGGDDVNGPITLDIQNFLAGELAKRPTERLIPRTALRGGRVDTFLFSWSKKSAPDHRLVYIDYNSLYPSVASHRKYPFPVGKMSVIINPSELKRITCLGGKCYFDKGNDGRLEEIHGVAHVKIIAPSAMEIPFLPFR